jgi:hypothetical protein
VFERVLLSLRLVVLSNTGCCCWIVPVVAALAPLRFLLLLLLLAAPLASSLQASKECLQNGLLVEDKGLPS